LGGNVSVVVLIANDSGTSLNSINNFYVKYLLGLDDKNALNRIRSRSQSRKADTHPDRSS
jgi:hypothetical protein